MSARRKAAGNSQRLAKTGACRGFASKPAPFFNARRCSFLFPHFSQGGDCCALRATMIYYDLTSSILSFSRPRPAGSHCENSGSSDGTGASARSDRAKSEVFRDRSASAGGDTRYFSRCLIFWCFWIKPKAQKKNFERRKIFRSILREASRPSIRRFLRGADLPPFVTKRWRQKCPQGTSVGIGRRFSLSGHKRLRCFARPLRALEPPSDLIPPPVQCGICGALRATMIYYDSNSSILKFSKPPRAEASARAAPWRRSVAAVDNTPPRQSRIKFALFSA